MDGSSSLPGQDGPSGYKVLAQRLDDSGTYNPFGEKISFNASHGYINAITDYEVVGKLEEIVSFA